MKIGIIGECMIELFDQGGGVYQRGFGGDTLNTAVYLARCTEGAVEVCYVSAMGDDDISTDMLTAWNADGVNTDLVEIIPGSVPGLYMIHTDDEGERSFQYWRDQAPVRQLFQTENAQTLLARLTTLDWIYYSGISLAVLKPEGQARLFAFLETYRQQGGKVAFDNNYRPRLWQGQATQVLMEQAYRHADLSLPSVDDEFELWQDDSVDSVIERLHGFGCKELVVKRGQKNCIHSVNGQRTEFPVVAADHVVDTTAAGDSFNGGYLASVLLGHSAKEAVKMGQNIARQVIAQRGAIVPVTV